MREGSEMMNLLKTWAKSPFLKGSDILIISECLKDLDPELVEEISKGKVVLTLCPEADLGSVTYGKLASIMRSVTPNSIEVVTVECSPHCLLLQAAVNEALYITGFKIPTRHYVYINGELKEISPDSIRVARYLHLVDKLVKEKPEILGELAKYSLEYKQAHS